MRHSRTVTCTRCNRETNEPRKGACWPCYLREYRGHSVGVACECCGHRDVRALRRHRLEAGVSTLCGNCSAVAGRRHVSLEALRAELGRVTVRDRRQADRRTFERRVKASIAWTALGDRRQGDRRVSAGTLHGQRSHTETIGQG